MMEKEKSGKIEKTSLKGTGLCGFGDNSNVAAVDTQNGKILRIRPLHYDWKFKPEEFKPWQLEARGKVFKSPLKTLLPPHALGYKKRIHSPNRILYPLKRVDWDPNGERNPQNRGTSGYVRISWDEATDLIANEIRRVIKKYGPESILAQIDGHGETKVVHASHGCSYRLLALLGGFTQQIRNPDSWEGWYWGAKHVWGCEPVGTMNPYHSNIYWDIAKNTDMIINQGCDPETTPWGFGGGQMPSLLSFWFTELGIKQVYICPDLNYGAAVHANKWIPIYPNTDAALQLAMAYYWITQNTFDKDYVATHTVGFDIFKEYVLGKQDGIPKTPKWASDKTGIPSRIIKALAREWAAKRTTVAHVLGGPYIRGAYCHEPARLEVVLLAMQGLGKPGIHQVCYTDIESSLCHRIGYLRANHDATLADVALYNGLGQPVPAGVIRPQIGSAYRGYHTLMPFTKQIIPKTMIHDAILDGHFEIHGSSNQMSTVEDQFIKYVYPVPGCSPVHMIWTDTPCLVTCWNDGNKIAEAYRHHSIEFMMAQHPWMENDCHFADIVLPINTKYEEDDVGDDPMSCLFNTVYLEEKCMEPVGESMSDYEAVCLIADKLGLLKEYTEGKSVDEWIKIGFDGSGVPQAGLYTWEKFKETKYYVVPTDPDWKRFPAGMLEFYKDPEKHPLSTPTGKLEIYSQRLAENFPDDEERPPYPKWIEGGPGWTHDERLSSERAKKYPLLVISNHPRWRVHANLDDVTWFHEIETCKVRGSDGYLYEPIWIHPLEAYKRDIKKGDVVKVLNERGAVLVGAYITERIMPGVVYIDHGARYDPIVPGELDRGGAINTITPHKGASKHCHGAMVENGFLVEVERVDLNKLMRTYPEAFNQPYDYAAGLRFERVLETDM
jgi:trimethylamine-N-oxide reductase (cytochrome c)